jgi:hypothetical protein
MQPKRTHLRLLVLALFPSSAYAYAEVLLFPFGILLSSLLVFVYLLFRPYGWLTRVAACVASLVAPILMVLTIPDRLFSSPVAQLQSVIFAAGFFPALGGGASIAWLLHKWRNRAKQQ